MSIVAIHDRIMEAAKIESAQILLPSGSCGKQNLRSSPVVAKEARLAVHEVLLGRTKLSLALRRCKVEWGRVPVVRS